jgi:hypothetical protein
MLGKTLLNLDKIGKTLDPDFEPNETIRKYSNELLKQRITKSASSSKPYEMLLEAKEFFEKLPYRINSLMDKATNNELEVKVKTVDEGYIMSAFQKIANRITAGIILGSLILGAALLMRYESTFTIFGYSGIAMIFFLIAAVGGLVLSAYALFRDEPTIKKNDHTKH